MLMILALPLLSGCQTSRYKEFETLKSGMSKADVLASVGGPARTQRWHGRDRWEYRLIGMEGEVVREVHFENGKSTYIGAAIKPAVSADEQDRLNEASNRAADFSHTEAASLAREGIQIQKFRPVDDADHATDKPATGK
jgi:outer membrane protein assembly factor BamE